MVKFTTVATRTATGIEVQLVGYLSNGCSYARVTSTYPGDLEHVVDPGYAEIFIEEGTTSLGICTQAIVFWAAKVELADLVHKKIVIRVNNVIREIAEVSDDKSAFARADFADTVATFIRAQG